MKNIITTLSVGMMLLAGLSSCLKDRTAIHPDNSYNVIEIGNISTISSGTTSPVAMFTRTLPVGPEMEFNTSINYAGADVAPQDINVNLTVDSATLTLYNTFNKVSYVLVPSTLYTMPSSVTIPKGQRTAGVTIKFKTSQFDLTKTYGFPLNIASASYGVISGNFGRVVYRLNAK